MNRGAVYLQRVARSLTAASDARDGLVLTVAALAAVGVWVIALVLGLPA